MSRSIIKLGKATSAGPVLGIDPDTHQTGFAIVANYKLVRAGLIRLPGRKTDWPREYEAAKAMVARIEEVANETAIFRSCKIAAIEGQHVYQGHAEVANDLLLCATVSGAAALAACHHGLRFDILEPFAWKGSVRKDIMFKRILRAAKLQFKMEGKGKTKTPRVYWGEIWPDPPESLQDQTHAIDAVGLALFGAGILHQDQTTFADLNVGPPKNFPPRDAL